MHCICKAHNTGETHFSSGVSLTTAGTCSSCVASWDLWAPLQPIRSCQLFHTAFSLCVFLPKALWAVAALTEGVCKVPHHFLCRLGDWVMASRVNSHRQLWLPSRDREGLGTPPGGNAV